MLTYPSNALVTYGFDGAGRVNWVKKDGNYVAQSVTYTPVCSQNSKAA